MTLGNALEALRPGLPAGHTLFASLFFERTSNQVPQLLEDRMLLSGFGTPGLSTPALIRRLSNFHRRLRINGRTDEFPG